MGNHGSVAIGGSLDAALEHALLLEWLAALHHRASALGAPRVLSADQQEDVVRQAVSTGYGTPSGEQSMKIATVGVHVLDTHVIGIESIPDGSDGQLVETIRMSPAGTAGGTAVVLSRLGAEVSSYGAIWAATRPATPCWRCWAPRGSTPRGWSARRASRPRRR